MTLPAVINPVVPLNLLFTHQRVICPQSRQSAKYRIVTHNFTNDDLTNGKSPGYQDYLDIDEVANLYEKTDPISAEISFFCLNTFVSNSPLLVATNSDSRK